MQRELAVHYLAGYAVPLGIMLSAILFLFICPALGQQTYVGRYDLYAGYAYLNSPHISLPENGAHLQAGVRLRRWCTVGVDYSIATGDLPLTPNLLTTALQNQLGAEFAGLASLGQIPSGYSLSVQTHSKTETFAAGPEFVYRHWAAVTPFVRPSVGAIYENATPHPADPIASGIVAQLAPSGSKQDWTSFYGFGGGCDWNVTKHFSLRVQADLVRDHLFNDLLKDARNTVRFSIGPAFQFGRNVAK